MTVTVSPSTTTLLAPPPQLPTVPNPTLQDQAFEELVRRAGVTTHNRENEIRNAHHLCRALRDGSTKQAEATGWAAADNYVLAPAQIVAVIDAAVAVYCPDQSGAWVYYPQAH
ncbi:DUF732 domain-containing protein [Mycobacterium sp. E3298]|uniref:DUF732 domain-containing protein n=1 Tax=Mycobacterium sp. E3298 TaxID=1856865 RepID=UPI0034CDA704